MHVESRVFLQPAHHLLVPIRMKGRFRLERVSFVPYERRPLRQFHDVRRGERSGDERVDARIEVGAEDDLLIHRAIVVVAQTAPGETHRLTLTAPDGQVIVLHDRERIDGTGNVIFDSSEDPLGVVSLLDPPVVPGVGPLPASGSQFEAALRESVGTYVVRRPRESLRALRGRPGSGTWTLSWIDFNEGRTADFNGWSLQLFGTPIARVAGEVVFASGSPDASFHDVKLDVVGTPVSVDERLIAFDRVTGRFEIRYLPGVRVDVLASKPGYAQAGISGLDAFDHPRGFVDGLAGFLAGGPGTDRLSIILRPTAEDVAPVVTAVPGHGESNPSLVRPVYGAALAGFGSMCARQTAIHAAIGGQIASLGVPATDGENRVWVGATPAPDSTNPRRNEECE